MVMGMPRGKRIIIEKEIHDVAIDKLKKMDVDEIRKEKEELASTISSSVARIFNEAQQLYKGTRVSEEELWRTGLYNLRDAYDYLRKNGMDLSFRAFSGRVERGVIPYVKIGKKRFLSKDSLNYLLNLKKDFYTISEAYKEYKKYNPTINYRAFIGRVEKGSIHSIKIGSKRLIPRESMDALVQVAKNYYSVSDAISKLYQNGIKIRRNAFERRLDRNRIPHVKIAGRRYIHKDILDELVEKEVALKEKGA